jgi:DinB superfamily
MENPGIQILLRNLDQGYDHQSWHGPVLRGSLRGVSAEQAAWRPRPSRHNVWEIAVHCAYWKYSVLHRLRPEIRFPLKGSNWLPRPEGEAGERAWKADLQILGTIHRDLRQAVASLSDGGLETVPQGSKRSFLDLILGVAHHDVYHAGQIQLLKRLFAAQ